jgi:hypothetical protein
MSSLKDLASLIMIPSLVKDGRLDTVKPLGNSIIHPDATGNNDGTDGSTPAEGNFTFSRGSNLAATRVDVNGLIEKGRENLILHSADWTNSAWNKTNVSVSANATTNPIDGNITADSILETTGNGQHNFFQLIGSYSGGETITISFYAKANGRTKLRMNDGSSALTAVFDLSAETGVMANGSGIPTITSVGNDWYRCSLFFVSNGSSEYIAMNFRDDLDQDTYVGDVTQGMYFFGAQAESSMVATDYIETGATTAQSGILEDLPRLDYSGGASCPSLLLEPQRSNLVPNSEYFEASQWTSYYSAISSNDSTSPDGFENATRWTSTAATTFLTTSLFVSDPSSFSVFVKYVDYPYILLYSGASGGFSAAFDIENNIIGTSGYNTSNEKIESYGNGWYRISCTFANASAGSSARIGFARALTSTWGDLNTSGGGEVLIYGAQFEAGSYPTSYIPTYGSAVTRSLDSCVATSVSDVIGQTEGTMFIDLTIDNLLGQNNPIPFTLKGSGSTSSYIQLYTSGRIQAVHYGFGSLQANINLPTYGLTDGRHKFAFVYSDNDFRFYIDGALAGSDTSGLVDAQSDVHLGYYNTNFNGTINNHQSLLFPTALTDSECIALTTL